MPWRLFVRWEADVRIRVLDLDHFVGPLRYRGALETKKALHDKALREKWWRGGGSNSRPSHCERDALPAELPPHASAESIKCFEWVGQGVEVEPVGLLADEAADFVEAGGAAGEAVAGDEFDEGAGGIVRGGRVGGVADDLEAEPLKAGWVGIDVGGAGGRVPGGEQVVGPREDERGVAGAHQRLGGGRLQVERAGVVSGAAVGQRQGAAARASGRFGVAGTGRGIDGRHAREMLLGLFIYPVP